MRLMALALCTLFAAASSPSSIQATSQEFALVPAQKSPLSQLFKSPPAPGEKRPQTVRSEVRPVIQGETRTLRQRVACGIKVIEGDPNVDRKIVIPIPEAGENAKIRVITPPPCEAVAAGGR